MTAKDLISRREALYELGVIANRSSGGFSSVQRCIGAIKGLPSKGQTCGSGKWIKLWKTVNGYVYRCSKCGVELATEEEEMFFDFCPYCGADMR